jgi:hypothetical protein
MKGVFGLTSAADLLKKLEREYTGFVADPSNADAAYNFFVTAWHLLEWKYPDPNPGVANSTRKATRDAEPLLQVCEHLARGAAHFENRRATQEPVAATATAGVWAPGTWAPGTWSSGAAGEWLEITLTGQAHKYGDTIAAHKLAEHVMDYWRAKI